MENKEMEELGHSKDEGFEVVMVEEDEEGKVKEDWSESEVVNWESLLPKMGFRVLLVEADDSTRQIIAALLRKCNYKVAAISDGLKAWEIVKQRHSKIDLILTELDLPSISGYALLTLIMEHDDCKNIPVIIMSSQDSISLVLKCMLKGAADFLIKPVRTNELKNLWRHVWKKLAMNGHNSENLATGHCKVEATGRNQSATDQYGDNISSCKKKSRANEISMEAQSSSTTPYLGAEGACMENMQDRSKIKHREETGLRHTKMKGHLQNIILKKQLPQEASNVGRKRTRLMSERNHHNDDANIATTLGVVEDKSSTGVATHQLVGAENHICRSSCNGDIHELPESSDQPKDLIYRISGQKCTTESSGNINLNSMNATPELELSLRNVHGEDYKEVDKRRTLKHSSASAFSWYSSNKKPLASTSVADLTEAKAQDDPPALTKTFKSDTVMNPYFAGQTSLGEAVFSFPQTELTHLSGTMVNGGFWTGYGPMLQPLFNPLTFPIVNPDITNRKEESPFPSSPLLHSDAGAVTSSQLCNTLDDATNLTSGEDGNELKNTNIIDQCEDTNSQIPDPRSTCSPCNETDTEHITSAYESKSEVIDANATASETMVTSAIEENSRADGGNPYHYDENKPRMGLHSAEREAALAKFRLKRKGRCYEKKVRYQSRKKLAEQRPRVKGQFVRQTPNQVCVPINDQP